MWGSTRYDALLERIRRLKTALKKSPSVFAMSGTALFICALLLLNFARLRRSLRIWMLLRRPARAPEMTATVFYSRMLRRLGRRGWRKLPEHTPNEFAQTITDPKLRDPVAAFTAHYERARFGNSAEDARALPDIYEQIRKG
jgi:hypothetical protein